jgi:signal transduction histidine kinase
MNIQIILLFIAATINSLLGLFVLLGKRDKTNIVYSIFVVFASLWAIGLSFFISESNLSQSLYIANSYYVFAFGISVFFYHFSKIFLKKESGINFRRVIIFLPLIVLIIIFFIDKNFLIKEVFFNNTNKDVIINHTNYLIYGVSFLLFVTFAYLNLFRSYFSKTDPRERSQLKLVLWGTSVGFLFGMIFDLILPFFGDYQHIFIGPIFSLFMVGSITYAITKYQMFNIKVVVTQTLVIMLWIFILVRIIISENIQEQVSNAVLLVITIIVGIFIIKSVRKEIEQREKIEKLAEELAGANEKLKELDQLKSEFLSLATHQIRAPLTAIKGYSSMLLDGDFGILPQKAKDSVGTIMMSCQNLINIVGDFLNISRIEQGRMVYEKSIFDVKELTKELLGEIKPNIDKAGLTLEINMPVDKIEVNADRDKIKQVIGNIVDNAIKYTPHGNINVSVFKEQGKAKIAIKDSGVGIDQAEINKLFNKFSRTKDANKTNITGTGLGLYIAKKMAEAHRGDIKVASEGKGKGTTFTIELPISNI